MTDSKAMTHEKLDARAVVILTVLCLVWGLNAVAMKYATSHAFLPDPFFDSDSVSA
jgi:hypothetical protein